MDGETNLGKYKQLRAKTIEWEIPKLFYYSELFFY